MAHEVLGADAYSAFVAEDAARARHLDMAAGMGYPDVIAAGRVTYDNGAVLTTAALGGKVPTDTAMLVIGSLPPARRCRIHRRSCSSPCRSSRPARSSGSTSALRRGSCPRSRHREGGARECRARQLRPVELPGRRGLLLVGGQLRRDGTLLEVTAEVCGDCVFLPLSQPVTCPLCAAFLGAPLVASVADCSIWPCNLCVSDSCFAPEYASARCVTENGVSSVKRSTTRGTCENPKTQQSECVVNAPEVEVVEQCPGGCDLLGRSCSPAMECVPSLNIGCPVRELERYCVGTAVYVREQNYRCNPVDDPITHDAIGGECTSFEGGITWRKAFDCPYDCSNGICQPRRPAM